MGRGSSKAVASTSVGGGGANAENFKGKESAYQRALNTLNKTASKEDYSKMPKADEATVERNLKAASEKIKETSIVQQSPAEKEIYSIARTPAYPSTASVVKRVPELKALDDSLKSAPTGTRIAFDVPYRDGRSGTIKNEKWIYEKTGTNNWKSTVIEGDRVRDNGSYRGIKALQSISDKKYRASYYNGEGITVKELNMLNNSKKK